MKSRNNSQNIKITKSLTEENELSYKENNDNAQLNKIKNNVNKNNNKVHPLDFYTLGIVHDPPQYTTKFCSNKAFQSTANDLIARNIFSLNSPKYETIKKDKNYSKLSQQNITENNYLKPLEVYTTSKKYSLDSNVSNRSNYNIAREKMFIKSNISLIKKGLNLTYSNFIDNKKRLMKDNSERKINKAIRDKMIEEKNLQRAKTFANYSLNNKSNNTNGINNEDNNTKYNITYTNPNDYSKKDLKGNILYFDKNNKEFIRHIRNWWIPDK